MNKLRFFADHCVSNYIMRALQVRNHPEIIPQMMEKLSGYLSGHPHMKHYEGKLFLVEAHRIRIRQ